MSKTLKTIILSSLFFLPTTTFGAFRFVPRLLAATERPIIVAIFNSYAQKYRLPEGYKKKCRETLTTQDLQPDVIKGLLDGEFYKHVAKTSELLAGEGQPFRSFFVECSIAHYWKFRDDFMRALQDEQDKQ